jgi:hypothetical protein
MGWASRVESATCTLQYPGNVITVYTLELPQSG